MYAFYTFSASSLVEARAYVLVIAGHAYTIESAPGVALPGPQKNPMGHGMHHKLAALLACTMFCAMATPSALMSSPRKCPAVHTQSSMLRPCPAGTGRVAGGHCRGLACAPVHTWFAKHGAHSVLASRNEPGGHRQKGGVRVAFVSQNSHGCCGGCQKTPAVRTLGSTHTVQMARKSSCAFAAYVSALQAQHSGVLMLGTAMYSKYPLRHTQSCILVDPGTAYENAGHATR